MVRYSIEVWQNNLLVNKNGTIPNASSLWGRGWSEALYSYRKLSMGSSFDAFCAG